MRRGLALTVGMVVATGLWLVSRSFPPPRVDGQTAASGDKLDQMLERLARIEARLDTIDQHLAATRPPFGDQWIARERLRQFSDQPTNETVAEQSGGWWPATFKEVKGDRTLVHFRGWDDSWNEWLGRERVRHLAAVEALHPDLEVLVKWNGAWLPATVVEVQGDRAQLAGKNAIQVPAKPR